MEKLHAGCLLSVCRVVRVVVGGGGLLEKCGKTEMWPIFLSWRIWEYQKDVVNNVAMKEQGGLTGYCLFGGGCQEDVV